MYRVVNDFVNEWKHSANGTIAVIDAITEDKKHFAIVDDHNSLEWIAWHLTTAPQFFIKQLGLDLQLDMPTEVPSTIDEVKSWYRQFASKVEQVIANHYTDEQLTELVQALGTTMPIGAVLRMLIDHQTHHRAQMQVLLRQAGLEVPPVMGPTKEMVK